MAESIYPPREFAMEQPAPPGVVPVCGWSWNTTFTVDGYLKKYNQGRQFKVTLPPLLPELDEPPLTSPKTTKPAPHTANEWGRRTNRELYQAQAVRDIAEQMSNLFRQAEATGKISTSEARSLQELVSRARQFIDDVDTIYQKWENYPCFRVQNSEICSWPLPRGDFPHDFRPQCDDVTTNPDFNTSSHSGVQEANGERFWCPASLESGGDLAWKQPWNNTRRPFDRLRIRDLHLGAYHHLRCAQVTYHRLLLQKKTYEAVRQADAGHLTFVPPPSTTTPTFGGIAGAEIPAGPDIPTGPAPSPEPSPGEEAAFPGPGAPGDGGDGGEPVGPTFEAEPELPDVTKIPPPFDGVASTGPIPEPEPTASGMSSSTKTWLSVAVVALGAFAIFKVAED